MFHNESHPKLLLPKFSDLVLIFLFTIVFNTSTLFTCKYMFL